MDETNSLVIFTRASQMLAEADTIQKTKELKDLALTAADFAKRKGMGEAAIQHCRSYALEAERKMGEMLKETERNVGGRPSKTCTTEEQVLTVPTIPELGITRKEASEAQRLADLPREAFDTVAAGKISVKKAISENKQAEKKKELIETEELRGKYRIFYADPPWQYSNMQHRRDEQETILEDHYPTLSIKELCDIPIKDHADDNAVLFLWTTSPFLEKSFDIVNAWGFEYKASMIWDKVRHNVGYYVSVRHELLLICTKGSCLPDTKELYDSVVSIERSPTHSEKPTYFRELIDKLYPLGRRIELFARSKSDGWNFWGNE